MTISFWSWKLQNYQPILPNHLNSLHSFFSDYSVIHFHCSEYYLNHLLNLSLSLYKSGSTFWFHLYWITNIYWNHNDVTSKLHCSLFWMNCIRISHSLLNVVFWFFFETVWNSVSNWVMIYWMIPLLSSSPFSFLLSFHQWLWLVMDPILTKLPIPSTLSISFSMFSLTNLYIILSTIITILYETLIYLAALAIDTHSSSLFIF